MPTTTAGFRLSTQAEGLRLLPHFPRDLNMQHGMFKPQGHADRTGLSPPLFSWGSPRSQVQAAGRYGAHLVWLRTPAQQKPSHGGALQYSPLCAEMTRGWGGIPAAPSARRWHSRQSARGSQEKASQRSQYQMDTVPGHCPSWQAHAELHKSLKKNRKE